MANPIIEPVARLVGRWRTARAIACLDPHMLDDAGFRLDRKSLTNAIYDKNGNWIGRQYK